MALNEIAVGQEQILIIRPDGPQGARLGLQITSAEEFKKFDEAIGELPEAERQKIQNIRAIAEALNIAIVD